jgi:pilus assembly protein CpaC
MQNSFRKVSPLWGGVLLALLVGEAPTRSWAQGPTAAAPARTVPIIVPFNGTIKLRMRSGKPIARVNNPKDTAVRVEATRDDPTAVQVTGIQPDVGQIELFDAAGNKEVFDYIVQTDVEFLRTQLKRAIPTAQVEIIPISANSVLLTGTLTRAEDVHVVQGVVRNLGFRYINAMRVGGVQQVQLDVVVAQVSREKFRAMAFNFLTNSKNFFFGSAVGNAAGEPTTTGVGSTLSGTLFGQSLNGATGTPNGAPTNLLFGVLHFNWGLLGFLQALKQENILKFVAEPRLVTLSGRAASFLVGGEQAVPIPAGLGQVGIQFEEFGTRLNFVPVVLGNGRILLEVEPEVSNLNPAFGTAINGTVVPGRTTTRVHTSVELETGQTFVLGGLIQHTVQGSTAKTPILGEIPYLGTFFNTKSYTDTEEEVLVLVTPHLVDAESCAQRPKMLPGQETRSPDDFELFLEGLLEAPRGSRQPVQGGHYVAAYKNSPSASVVPCPGNGPFGFGGPGGPRPGGPGLPGPGMPAGPGMGGPGPDGHAPGVPGNLPIQPSEALPAPMPGLHGNAGQESMAPVANNGQLSETGSPGSMVAPGMNEAAEQPPAAEGQTQPSPLPGNFGPAGNGGSQ